MDLFNLFFTGREDFLALIKAFEAKWDIRFISKLEKENNRANFLSTMAEIRFGLFFGEISEKIQYDAEIYNKRPDYLIQANSQQILLEVARLNPADSDQRQLDFESGFMDALQEINMGCLLTFDYDEGEVDYKATDFSPIKEICFQWLQSNREQGDELMLPNKILLIFEHYSDLYSHVNLIGGGGTIDFDYRRLVSQNSALVKKCMKYAEIIREHKLPYIVCLFLDFNSWFSLRDLYPRLYGVRVTDYGHNDDPVQFTNFEDALYYSSIEEIKNVTGILVFLNGEFTYFHNYSSKVKLNNSNLDLLLKWQYIKK
jgi:hypothetical protein